MVMRGQFLECLYLSEFIDLALYGNMGRTCSMEENWFFMHLMATNWPVLMD